MKKLIALWIALKAIEREVGQDAAWIWYSESVYESGRHISKRRAYVEAWFGFIAWRFKFTLCGWFGHKWIDCSSAGPDSGDMDIYCDRCGHSFHHTLY